jgi:IS5 family transposase
VASTERPLFAHETMLRIHFLQQWFGRSDLAMVDALFDIPMYRDFVDLSGAERIPDGVGTLRVVKNPSPRHLLAEHQIGIQIFAAVNASLIDKGLMPKSGTVVDVTLISAPSSTKNSSCKRDPEILQTKKGNQWQHGMKGHIGLDAESGLVHSVKGTAANVNDMTQAHALVHAEEPDVFADAGYQGVAKRGEMQDIKVNWHVAMRPGKRKVLDKSTPMGAIMDKLEQVKASIRAEVEHPFRVIKRLFGHVKVRYWGLMKNMEQLHTLFSLSNLWMARHRLLQRFQGWVRLPRTKGA